MIPEDPSDKGPTPTHVGVPVELMERFAEIVDKAGCREPLFVDPMYPEQEWRYCGDELPGAHPPFVLCEGCKVRVEVGAIIAAFMEIGKESRFIN